jgi:ribosome biogenesis GTPase A
MKKLKLNKLNILLVILGVISLLFILCLNKPVVYAINKSDLISSEDAKIIETEFIKQGKKFVFVVGTSEKSAQKLYNATVSSLNEVKERYAKKGVNKPLRVMVAGIPNTGKSTLVNNLCGKARTKTGNKPGVTRGKQWVTIDNGIEVLDMPGTLWPSFDDKTVAQHLAYLGSIKDDVLDIENLAFDFINEFKGGKNDIFEQRYGVQTEDKETIEIFDEICLAKKCVLKGNEPDYERCARMIIDDFRKGRFGKIILDKYAK